MYVVQAFYFPPVRKERVRMGHPGVWVWVGENGQRQPTLCDEAAKDGPPAVVDGAPGVVVLHPRLWLGYSGVGRIIRLVAPKSL